MHSCLPIHPDDDHSRAQTNLPICLRLPVFRQGLQTRPRDFSIPLPASTTSLLHRLDENTVPLPGNPERGPFAYGPFFPDRRRDENLPFTVALTMVIGTPFFMGVSEVTRFVRGRGSSPRRGRRSGRDRSRTYQNRTGTGWILPIHRGRRQRIFPCHAPHG